MNKQLLDSFISKYSLGGNIESVAWEVKDGKTLSTRFMPDSQTVLGELTLKDMGDEILINSNGNSVENAKFGVYNTSQIQKILSLLTTDDLKLSVTKTSDDEYVNMKITENKTNYTLTYPFSDLSIIPRVPSKKSIPDEYDLEVVLDKTFIETFIKLKQAFPNVDPFIHTDDGEVSIVVGYQNKNSQAFRLPVEVYNDVYSELDKLFFSGDMLREVLSANKKDMSSQPVLKVSEKGLAYVSFENDVFLADYYLPALDINE